MKFNKFNKKLPTLFLDPLSEYGAIDSSVNIILSPSLYWVKKVSLPVKYARDAKKLLPSIFEDILPDGKYNYYAYKSDDEFIIFAYSDKLIIDTLAQKGIPLSNVANIYFAQSEVTGIEGALKINEAQSIYVKDEILILVPCCWIEEKGELDLAKINLSKHNIALEKFGHIVETKSLYKIGAILMVLILLITTEYFITADKVSTILTAKDELFEKNSLQSTTFQNKSMLKKYKAIHQSQTNLRDIMSVILSLRLKSDEKISFIDMKSKKIIISFSGVKEGKERAIINTLKAKKLQFKKSFVKENMKIEVRL